MRTTGRRGLGRGSGACVCVSRREREKYLERRYPEVACLSGKRHFLVQLFLPSLGQRTGLGPEHFPLSPRDRKPTLPMPSLSPHAGTSFPAGSSVCAPFSVLLSYPCPLSANPQLSLFQTPVEGGWGPSTPRKRGTQRPTGLHGCTITRATCGSVRGQGPLLKLPLLFLHLRKGHFGLDCVVDFPWRLQHQDSGDRSVWTSVLWLMP